MEGAMMSIPVWLMAKNRFQLSCAYNASTCHSLPSLVVSRILRDSRFSVTPREQLTGASPLRTVASTITVAKENSTCPRMTLGSSRQWKMMRRGTRRVRLSPGCWSTAPRSVMPRSLNVWSRVVTSRLRSSKPKTTVQTLGMPFSYSRAGGAATTSCASIGLPAHDCSRTWAGSWRSSAWSTGSKDLWQSRSPLRTLRRLTPVWLGVSRCDGPVCERREEARVLVCFALSRLTHPATQERRR